MLLAASAVTRVTAREKELRAEGLNLFPAPGKRGAFLDSPLNRAPPFGVGGTPDHFSFRIAKEGRQAPDIASLR